ASSSQLLKSSRDILPRMSPCDLIYRTLACCLFCAVCSIAAVAQSTHYSVKLVPDFGRQLLRGEETIEFQSDAGLVEWKKQAGLRILSAGISGGPVTVDEQTVRLRLRSTGKHLVHFKFSAAAGRGIKWLANNTGLLTAFYCEAWMVCDNSPGQRASLRL